MKMILTSQKSKKIFRQFILFITSLLCTLPLYAQTDSTFLDTKGTDFWLTFPPNYHNGVAYFNDDSLYIFITSVVPVKGKIEYIEIQGNKYSRNFSIPDPTKIYIFSIYNFNYELLGFNDISLNPDNRNNSEIITKQFFHITSDNEVFVFAHNQAQYSSDACIIYPTDVLSKDYFIMSYNSDGTSGNINGISPNSTPSQFVVLATEDSTKIHISPKAPTEYYGLTEQNFYLNKGEAYLVQAYITANSLRNDLTGSEVHSDKPVAVFAGHQRATIPNSSQSPNPSRDYILEQMPPIETWGMNVILIPFQLPSKATTEMYDIYRILAGFDNTDIFINDSLTVTLNKGEFYEGALTNAFKVRASLPVLVVQFKKTSDFNSTIPDSFKIGDPFEMLIPPIEQYMKSYQVINLQTWIDDPVKVYIEQYISIIAEDSSISFVSLDGVIVPSDSFKTIPTSNYKFANISVSEGRHTISSNSKIGVNVYGYGEACSYGFCGGMAMDPISLVGIEENKDEKPFDDILLQNYPNPSSSMSIIKFDIKESGHVLLVIYDLLGNQRMTVFNENLMQGIYEIDINTDKLEQGIYIYSLNTGRNAVSRLMIIRK